MGLRCRSCKSDALDLVVDLGPLPASDDFPLVDAPVPDAVWPLEVWLCAQCTLAQLRPGVDVPPGEPLAVVSRTAVEHARVGAALAVDAAPTARTVRLVDSHHGGSWRDELLGLGLDEATSPMADLVVDNHALSHEPDLRQAVAKLAAQVAPGGRLVLEFFHFLSLVDEHQFDNVRHGHPLLLALGSLSWALRDAGLVAVDAVPTPVYGGSLVVVAARADDHPPVAASVDAVLAAERENGLADPVALRGLRQAAARSAEEIRAHLVQAKAEGRIVLGYGAPSKASVLLGLAGITVEELPFTVDRSRAKVGRRIPGCGVPIRSVDDLIAAAPDEVLVLTWDIASEVVTSLPEVTSAGGCFWVPLPELRRLDVVAA